MMLNEKLFDITLKLSKQASDWVDQVHPHVSYRVWHNYHKTKLAELLLKEAENAISVQTNGFKTAEESIWRTNCVHELRKHFGIK